MSTIKLVTPDFKPRKIKHNVTKLLDEIEELKERLAEETKRADEFFDELEKFRRNNHHDYEVIDKYEHQDNERDKDILEEVNYLLDEIKITKERAALGIYGQAEELETLIEKLNEVI